MVEDYKIRGPLSPEEAEEYFEDEVNLGRVGGGGRGPKKGERGFGSGKAAHERRAYVAFETGKDRRQAEEEDWLVDHLKKAIRSENEKRSYWKWLEQVLAGGEAYQDEDVIVSFTRPGKPGGQHMQKTSNAADAVHEPTGLMAHAEDTRSRSKNEQLARARLERKVLELAQRWKSYSSTAGEEAALALFERANNSQT